MEVKRQINHETHNVPVVGEGAGLFGPRSMFWQVWQETAGLLGSGRAILLQLAHPLVAQGVADHSQFQGDPLGRLERTLEMMLTIVFGDRASAEGMLRQFHALHGPIRGTLPLAAGPFAPGVAYTAQDPALKLWVHATLMDTGLLVYERFVRPLTQDEREHFYADSQHLALRMGIPAKVIPATLAQFQEYMDEVLSSEVLVVTDTTRALAADVLNPNVSLDLRLVARVEAFVTAGLLPERLREAYGMQWDPRRQMALDAMCVVSRSMLPLMPAKLRLMPQARTARRRLVDYERLKRVGRLESKS